MFVCGRVLTSHESFPFQGTVFRNFSITGDLLFFLLLNKFGLFIYFPSIEYAEDVILKMLEKANHTVSIYELPNLDLKEECEQMRREDNSNYDNDYKDLPHLYYSKQWFIQFALKHDLHLMIFDQLIPKYTNGKYRFCVVLRKNM